MYHENELAWNIWSICSKYARGVSFSDIAEIVISEVRALVIDYEGTLDDFEKVLLIEETALPLIREIQKNRRKAEEQKKEFFGNNRRPQVPRKRPRRK